MRAVDILLVEDNPGDVRLLREVFGTCATTNHLVVARDGVEAMELIRQGLRQNWRPDLILLDLNLPRKDGREVLLELKEDPELRKIPVVVLSSSRAERDISQSYELHASCHIVKPFDLSSFVRVVRSIEQFWLSTAALPGA